MVRRLVLFLVALGLVAGPALVLAAPASSVQASYLEVRASEAFSPNGDGRRDEAVVRYAVPERGDVSLVLQNTDSGYPVDVRTDPLGEQAAGDHTWRWDGLDDQGAPAPEGGYAVRLTWTAADGRRLVTGDYTYLDTSLNMGLSPRTTWGLPLDAPQTVYPRTEVVRDSVSLVAWTERVRQATLLIKDSSGRNVLSRDVTDAQDPDLYQVVWTARRGGEPLPAGRYRAFLRITDLAGNEGRSAALRLRVSREVLQWRRATRGLTPARSARGESYGCWTGAPSCGEVAEPCGTVASSAIYPGGLSYRSGECSVPAAVNGAEGVHWLPVPAGVRGVAAARVAFTGRPTVEGEPDAGSLLVYGDGWLSSKEATSSTGARTGWVRGLRMGQGDTDLGYPPGVLWSFRTSGTDAVDVDRFTVTMRYLAVGD